MQFNEYSVSLNINSVDIKKVKIGQHYLIKHGAYMSDSLILELVQSLDGGNYNVDSATKGKPYYAADVINENFTKKKRIYRLIWIFEGESLEILGVVNAYRRRTKKKDKL